MDDTTDVEVIDCLADLVGEEELFSEDGKMSPAIFYPACQISDLCPDCMKMVPIRRGNGVNEHEAPFLLFYHPVD